MVVKNDIFTFHLHFTALMFELVTFLSIILIAFIIFRKWRERKTIATLYLLIALFSIAFAAFMAFTGLMSWLVSWIANDFAPTLSPAYYPLSLPLGYTLVIVYDIFIVLFAIQIFMDKNTKKVIPFVISGVVIAALLFLPTNYWGVDPEVTDPASTRILILGIFLLYNAITCILLTYYALKEAGRTENKLHQRGFQAIAFGFITNLLVFVFFLIDSILIMLNPGSPGYSIFISLGWVCAFITAFMFYLGYILPNWFRNRIEKQ